MPLKGSEEGEDDRERRRAGGKISRAGRKAPSAELPVDLPLIGVPKESADPSESADGPPDNAPDQEWAEDDWADEAEEDTPVSDPAPSATARTGQAGSRPVDEADPDVTEPEAGPTSLPARASDEAADHEAAIPSTTESPQFATPKPKMVRVRKPKKEVRTTAPADPGVERIARLVRPAGLLLFLTGWWLAVLFGHGSELHRLYWPSLFAGLGALMVAVTSRGRLSDFPWTGFVFLVFGSLYFLIRAWASPVYDLGRMDIPLVCGFGMAVIVGATKPDWKYVAPILAVVALGHALASAYQLLIDQSFAIFRHNRSDTLGVSGLYFHRNYLAGFLEIFIPFWGTMVFGHRGSKPWTFAFNALILVLAGLVLFLTNSRGGLAAAGIGFLVAMAIVGVARWRAGHRKTRGAIVAIGGISAVVFLSVLLFLIKVVFEQRGKAAQLTEGIGEEGRLGLVGLAYEQWMRAPLFGSGSRSFSYEATKNWDFQLMPTWLGSPNMVHNDYLQVLTDYGVFGLVPILGFAAWLAYFAIRRVVSSQTDRRRPGEGWIPAAVVGALAASTVHGVVDFNLHILPNIMMFGLVLGLLPGLTSRKNHEVDLAGWSRFKGPALAVLTGILAISWFGHGWRELLAIPDFVRLEQVTNSYSATDESRLEASRRAFLKAPNFRLARHYGNVQLKRASDDKATPLDKEIGTSEAIIAYEVATRRHPYEGTAMLNYAIALDNADRFEDSTAVYQRAIDLLWRREAKFGAMMRFAMHLGQRGDEHYEARERPQALAYFELAKQYLEESYRLNYRPDPYKIHMQDVEFLTVRIDYLREKGFLPAPLPDIAPPPSLLSP